MLDLIYLIIVLLVGIQLTKLSISGTTYGLLLGSFVMLLLITSFLILSDSQVSEIATNIVRSIEQFGLGYPETWRRNSKIFREVIDGCYYLTLYGAAICLFLSASYEGKRMQIHRENKTKKSALFLCFVVFISFLYFAPSTSADGFHIRKMRRFFSTEFGILIIESLILYAAVMAGMQLRAIFNKQY
jgi:hypothetical protein